MRVRILTAADLHQSRLHYRSLALAVREHQPDGVALVGDFLYGFPIGKYQFPTDECARLLSDLSVGHLLFIRGNHEDVNWRAFVRAWPFAKRPLTALYGSVHTIGPLSIVGFPCKAGSEFTWCNSLPKDGNNLLPDPNPAGRPALAADTVAWLPGLMRQVGPAGRLLWLMHEPPIGEPIAKNELFQPAWRTAVERCGPAVVVSGHDHDSPLSSGRWYATHRQTVCINVGQEEMDFHYCVLDFEFAQAAELPSKISIRAFPQEETFAIDLHD